MLNRFSFNFKYPDSFNNIRKSYLNLSLTNMKEMKERNLNVRIYVSAIM